MAKAVKLEDIAKRVGVSNVTVSKALADKSGVSETLRKQIKEIAHEMGYIPMSSQKAKNKKETGNIGIIVPNRFIDNSTSFYWSIYQNVVTRLQELGYYAILEILSLDEEENCKLPKLVEDDKVDGLIIIGQIKEKYSNFIWNNKKVHIMFLDFYDNHMEYDTIISDGFYGMYVLTDYLIKMGHRQIAFVGTPLATSSITDRMFGYQKALLENHIEINKCWIIPDRDIDATTFKIELPEILPTAIACNSDYAAACVINELRKNGVSVPEDISVVGFDNYLAPNVANLQITTYEVKIDKMIDLCIKTLIKKINKKEYVKGVQIVTGEMIIKETVTPPKSAREA